MPDAYLDADEIRASTFIRHVAIHDTLGSTNDRAAELARDVSIELPALIAARHQTAGRGRGKNTWWTAEGGLTFSILLEPVKLGVSTANWPQLSLASAVAVCDAISTELNPQSACLSIKWPNDIMVDGAKLCGILIESPGGITPAKDCLIIGIGINVNNSWHKPDPAAQGRARHLAKPANAISLCETTGQEHKLQPLLCETLRALEKRIAQLAAHDQQLPIAWQQLCWLTDQNVEVQANGKCIDGVCLGIDAHGRLLVEDVFETHRIQSGSVSVL